MTSAKPYLPRVGRLLGTRVRIFQNGLADRAANDAGKTAETARSDNQQAGTVCGLGDFIGRHWVVLIPSRLSSELPHARYAIYLRGGNGGVTQKMAGAPQAVGEGQ